MNRTSNDSDALERIKPTGLPKNHPGHGLVSARQFARLRMADLVPRPIERRRKSTGYGSTVVYPDWTRAQLLRQIALEEAGVRGDDNQRLLLWIDGCSIPLGRIAADLKIVTDSALAFAARARQGLEADRMVFEMLDTHDPSQFMRWARKQLPDRTDLEAALLQMVQLASGTSPADLMLDCDSARPLHLLMGAILPGVVPSPAELANAMSLDNDFGAFMRAAATFPVWSLHEWVAARDDQLLLRRTGNWDLPIPELSGFLLLSTRLAFLIACGAMRRADSAGWDARLDEIRKLALTQIGVDCFGNQEDRTKEAC